MAQELEQRRPAKRRHGFPPSLRVRVARFVEGQREQGHSWSSLSERLGVSGNTLLRWVDAEAGGSERVGGGFAKIHLVPAAATGPGSSVGVEGLAIESPNGFRLTGLSLADAVRALTMLR